MELTSEQMDVVWHEIHRKWTGNKECFFCGGTDWRLSESTYNMIDSDKPLVQVTKEGVLVKDYAVPVMTFVVLRCANCAHSHFFNAVELGIFPDRLEEPGPHAVTK